MKKFLLILSAALLLAGCTDKREYVPADKPVPAAEEFVPTAENAAEPAPAVENVSFAGGEVPGDAEELTMALREGETALLDELPGLRCADLKGSSCEEELIEYAYSHPELELLFTVTLPTGETENTAEELDLSGCTAEELFAAAPLLRAFPGLNRLVLGDLSEEKLPAVAELRRNCPCAVFEGTAPLLRRAVDISSSELDLNSFQLAGKKENLDDLLACLADGTRVDICGCDLAVEDYGELFDKYPRLKIVTYVYLAKGVILKTDSEVVLCNNVHNDVRGQRLRFFRDCWALDLGHSSIKDLDFVENMPNLSVLILAHAPVEDLSPLLNCPKLEYFEVYGTKVTDLSPLAGMTCLEHINVCNLQITDLSPLKNCPLKRLWIDYRTTVSEEELNRFRADHPDCKVGLDDPSGWRKLDDYTYDPRYAELRDTFKY